jgi:hypothetical protein
MPAIINNEILKNQTIDRNWHLFLFLFWPGYFFFSKSQNNRITFKPIFQSPLLSSNLYWKVTSFKRSPVLCNTTFSLSQRWPLNRGYVMTGIWIWKFMLAKVRTTFWDYRRPPHFKCCATWKLWMNIVVYGSKYHCLLTWLLMAVSSVVC